jgi:hypothetical protein
MIRLRPPRVGREHARAIGRLSGLVDSAESAPGPLMLEGDPGEDHVPRDYRQTGSVRRWRRSDSLSQQRHEVEVGLTPRACIQDRREVGREIEGVSLVQEWERKRDPQGHL